MTFNVIAVSLFISFIWGITPIVHKYIFSTVKMSPHTLIVSGAVLYFTCSMVYFAHYRKEAMEPLRTITPGTIALMILTAVLGFYANYLYFNVISKNESYLVSALIFSSPFFTLIFAYLFLKEDISLLSALGVGLIVLGVIVIASAKKPLAREARLVSTIKGD